MNTLDLVGDGDEIELIQEIETGFGIRFDDAKLERLRIIGELYDLVCRKVDFDQNAVCLSARAFRALRDAFPVISIGPKTPIAILRGNHASDREWCRETSHRSGFDFDLSQSGPIVSWACFLSIFTPPALALLWTETSGYGALAWLMLWFALPLFQIAPTHLPQQVATAGDLVRWSMGRNYARLRESGGIGTRADVWLVVCGIARDAACFGGPINRDTTLFP